MPSLKAWEQGSGAPAHRQVVQGPALNCLSESGEACVANVVVVQPQLLCMAHQTNVLRQESAHAKSQGMVTRHWGASTPATGPAPRWPQRVRQGLEPDIANLVRVQVQIGQVVQAPPSQ